MNRSKQKGSQIVEFAFALPVLLVFILLALDFGFLVYDKAIITNAGREAARKGTTLSAATWSSGAVKQVACDYAKTLLISTSSGSHTDTCTGAADPVITVTLPFGGTAPTFGQPVKIAVSYPYNGFLTSVGTWTSAWVVTSSAQMNHE